LIPAVRWGGRPADYARREIVNAILYVLRTGCQWRAIPHDLPPWQLVYAYFRTWRRTGTWAQIHETLRQQLRRKEGRHPQASAAILDSQSVKTTEKGDRAATMRARKLKAEKGTF
jgi:transposase